MFPQTPMLYWVVQYLELHEEYVPSVREALIPQSCYIFLDNHSLSTRLIFNDTRMSMAIYNGVFSQFPLLSFPPRLEVSALEQFFI